MGQPDSCSCEFGPFRIDPLKRVLYRGGEPLALNSRAFDTLLTLVQNAGITVAKEEIIERVWGDTIVEENNLTQCISALRKALGEGPGSHQFIATVPRTGYRFVATVVVVRDRAENHQAAIGTHDPAAAAREELNTGSLVQNPKSKIKNRTWLAAAVLALSAAGIFWLAKSRPGQPKPLVHEAAQPEAGTGRMMLAVLPFENLTGDPKQGYLADGFTEELITQLGRLDPDHLGVIARTSVMRYKDGSEGIRQIAHDLGVGYILEGSVRRSGNDLRISAQLIKASDQTHVWSQSYDGRLRSAIALEQAVAGHVEEHIANRLDHSAVRFAGGSRPVNQEAYRAYTEGLYFLNQRDVADYQKAIGAFQSAIRKDSNYALAYAGLADVYSLLVLDGAHLAVDGPKAQAAAARAVTLDPSAAEGHAAMAAVSVLFRWDWPAAEREFKLSLRENPNYALAHHWYATLYLGPQGGYAEAITEMKLAQRLDPVSLIVNTDLGWAYFIAGRRAEAFAQYQRTLRLDERFVPVHYRLFEYYVSERMYPQALRELVLDAGYSGDSETQRKVEHENRAGAFPKILWAQIESEKHNGSAQASILLARNYALLGRNDEAFQALRALFQAHDPSLIYVKVDPELASLHADPRFQELERRCGLSP